MKKSRMKVHILSRKTIKPASPTPPHLRTFNLSLFDQQMSPIYANTVFFYPPPINNGNGDIISKVLERSRLLQKSLSETLVFFYPMAGQYKDPDSIDCNDKGVYFVEARISCQLVDYLSQPDPELLNCFIPTNDPKATKLALHSTTLVQLSFFDCGGMAIAVSLSHKLADASSAYTFIQSWAAMTLETGEIVLLEFIRASLLPPRDLGVQPTPTAAAEKCTTRRFVFDATKIASLKAKIGDSIGQRLPSKVETVCSFILKCAITASQSKSGSSMLLQYVNLRRRMLPSMPENTIGNPIWAFEVLLKESEMELDEIVGKMRKGLTEFCNKKVNKFRGDGGYDAILESIKERELLTKMGVNTYWCTSWCKLPLYEIEFGWGKPMWVASRLPVNNLILLMDTKYGDGIEAWVTLDQQVMAKFECNEELLACGSFNSSAFVKHYDM